MKRIPLLFFFFLSACDLAPEGYQRLLITNMAAIDYPENLSNQEICIQHWNKFADINFNPRSYGDNWNQDAINEVAQMVENGCVKRPVGEVGHSRLEKERALAITTLKNLKSILDKFPVADKGPVAILQGKWLKFANKEEAEKISQKRKLLANLFFEGPLGGGHLQSVIKLIPDVESSMETRKYLFKRLEEELKLK